MSPTGADSITHDLGDAESNGVEPQADADTDTNKFLENETFIFTRISHYSKLTYFFVVFLLE